MDYATADGSASAGLDYVATSGTLTFAPGDTTATVTVPLLDDDLHEGDETFTVSLSNPSSSTGLAPAIGVGTATVTILEDDALADFSIASVSVNHDAGSVTLTVTRLGALGGNDSIKYTTVNGTALAGQHFTAVNGTLEFAPGASTATITVPILKSAVASKDRAFTVVLSNPAGDPVPTVGAAEATVTITYAGIPSTGIVVTGQDIVVPVTAALLLLGVGAALTLPRLRRTGR